MVTMCKMFLTCCILFYSNSYPPDWSQHPLIVTGTLKNPILFCIVRKDFGTVNRLLPIVYWFYLAWRKDPRALTITLLHLRGCYPKEELVLLCIAKCILTCYKKRPHKQGELINSDMTSIKRQWVHLIRNVQAKPVDYLALGFQMELKL